MKNILKITLASAALFLTIGSGTAFAQKFGYVNTEEIILQMPEMDSVRIKMDAMRKDFADQYELMRVEYNNKINDYQNSRTTLTDAGRQLKEQELQKLAQSIQEFEQSASEMLQEEEYKLFAPLAEKAQNAIRKIAQSQSLTGVISSAALLYADENNMVDIMPLIKPELGIK